MCDVHVHHQQVWLTHPQSVTHGEASSSVAFLEQHMGVNRNAVCLSMSKYVAQ